MKKKTISILMAALLTMTATLTGCGNTDNSENSVSDETQKNRQQPRSLQHLPMNCWIL